MDFRGTNDGEPESERTSAEDIYRASEILGLDEHR